jgi:hypothetical protein
MVIKGTETFILTNDNLKFELFRSSDDLTFIFGKNDLAAYYGGGDQTIYDFGQGIHLQFSEITAPIKVYGLCRDPNLSYSSHSRDSSAGVA